MTVGFFGGSGALRGGLTLLLTMRVGGGGGGGGGIFSFAIFFLRQGFHDFNTLLD